MTKNDPKKKPSPIEITCSRKFIPWLQEENISFGFSTYQTNRLFLIGTNPEGAISAFERLFDRPMGLYSSGGTLYLSTRYLIWKFINVLSEGQTHNGYDRLYVPRISYNTAELDVHDLAVDDQGRLLFMNTLYSCLAAVSDTYSFEPLWHPPFITKIAPEDRCHLNGLALKEGRPAYATAISRSDVAAGWRKKRDNSGCVIDIDTNEIVHVGLSMPHSPRWYMDQLWVLNSGTGDFGYIDLKRGEFEPVCFCPGYMRGLCFHKHYAIIGLSKPRERTFSGLELDRRLEKKDSAAQCGFAVVDLHTGDMAHWLEIEGVVSELYDVQVLTGCRRPMALGFKTDEICRVVSTAPWEGSSVPIQRFYVAPAGSSPTAPGAMPGVPSQNPNVPVSGNPAINADQGMEQPMTLARRPPGGLQPSGVVGDINIFSIPEISPRQALANDTVTFPRLSQRWRLGVPKNPLAASAAGNNGRLVGSALAQLVNRQAELISWFVGPEHRGKGVGKALLETVENLLREKNCTWFLLNYRTDWPSAPVVEKIGRALGWSPPEPARVLYRGERASIENARWIHETAPDPELEIFFWKDLPETDKRDILKRQQDQPWFPEQLNPFQGQAHFEPLNSLGVRVDGRVMGWIITHRTAPDTIQYTSLCLHPTLRKMGKAMGILAESIRLQYKSDVSVGIFMVDVQNSHMLEFAKKYIEPYMANVTKLMQMRKQIQQMKR